MIKRKKKGEVAIFLLVLLCIMFFTCSTFLGITRRGNLVTIEKLDNAQVNANLSMSLTDLEEYARTGNYKVFKDYQTKGVEYKKFLDFYVNESNLGGYIVLDYKIYVPYNPKNIGDGNYYEPDRIDVYSYRGDYFVDKKTYTGMSLTTPDGNSIEGLTVYSKINWEIKSSLLNYVVKKDVEKTTDIIGVHTIN